MNCNECKNLLIEFSEGLLDTHVKESMEQHMKECQECRKEAENILALQDRLLKNSHGVLSVDLVNRVMDQIAREKKSRSKTTSSADYLYQIRSFLMKNTLLKIAATAVLVLAVFIGLNFSRNGVSFAQVAEPILHARTLEYDVVTLEYGTYHDIVAEGKIRRINYMPQDLIIDLNNLTVLHLDNDHKTAAFAKPKPKASKWFYDNNRDFLRLVRSAVEEALNGAPSAVEKLGKKTIDGHGVYGFKLQSGMDGEAVIIWADRDTSLPVQIDIHLGMSYQNNLTTTESLPTAKGGPVVKIVGKVLIPTTFTLKNIRFDVPVDESLMEMPSDYKLIDMKQFGNLSMENAFIEMLRLWAEKISDGFFPESLPLEGIRDQFLSVFPDIMKWTPDEREELIPDELLRTVGLGYEAKQSLINLTPEEWEKFTKNVFNGFWVISAPGTDGSEWHYSGSGVRLGDGDREIFRYKMPDTSSWRVIYGDLHAEDLPAENTKQ